MPWRRLTDMGIERGKLTDCSRVEDVESQGGGLCARTDETGAPARNLERLGSPTHAHIRTNARKNIYIHLGTHTHIDTHKHRDTHTHTH